MPLRIPRFQSDWSGQMAAHLLGETDDAILDALPEICDSWGDKGKWERVAYVVCDAMETAEAREQAFEFIVEWSGEFEKFRRVRARVLE